MSDCALLRTRRIFGYAAVAAMLVWLAIPIIGLGEPFTAVILGVALAFLFGWWWFGHCLEVRRIAEGFRDPHSRAERDIDR